MDFYAVLAQVMALLQREGRVSYRALKRQFSLDDDLVEDLKDELIYAKRLALDEDSRVLVWTGGATMAVASAAPPSQSVTHSATLEAAGPQRAPLLAAPSPPEAERRQLTVLFCDLVGSTALSAQLDPEELREVVRAYQDTCAKVIARFEGHIAQYLGDGLLVYFGYPLAHEDDAQRAVRSGLEIVEAVRLSNMRLEREHGVRLAVRLGIHTGLVVIGKIGSGGRQEQLALGETPNLAARLQGLAAPDTVVISAATAHLVHGYFVCQPLGAQELRGLAQPFLVYQVVQASEAQTRLDVVTPRGLTPLVGREEEVCLLQRRWEQATTGLGQVVLLSGEAGIGKSRLVQVLKDAVAHEPHVRIEWRGSPYHQQSALSPVIDHMYRLLRGPHEASPAEQLRSLEAVLTASGMALTEAVPLLAALLALPLPDAYAPLTLTPPRQHQQTLETLLAWLHAEAQRQPVLLIVEDLHWIDPSTLELLSVIIDHCDALRLCLALTARPEFHPPWAMLPHFTTLTLRRLAAVEVGSLVTHVVGDKTFPAVVLQEVVRKTDGVPLFVEELTKMVLASGLLEEQEDHYTLHGPLPPLAIPATLHDALLARLDRLAVAKVVAQLGATIGRAFTYDVVQAVALLDDGALQGALAQLVAAEIVTQRGRPPRAMYTFKHALIQDVAYESLLRSTRQQYHQRIAEVLVERFPETAETQSEVLAQHYTAAGLHEQALACWKHAGERALGRSAHQEAVTCFEQALGAVQQLPESRDLCEQAIDLRFALRTALLPSGAFERILAVLREAEALATALDDAQRLGRISVFMTIHFHFAGDQEQAIPVGQRALTLAAASSDVGLYAVANTYLSFVYHHQGHYPQAMDCCRQTLATLDGPLRHERFGQVVLPAVLAHAFLTWCLAEVGRFAESRSLGAQGCQIAEEADHPASRMYALWGAGLPSLYQGDFVQALPRLERAMRIWQDIGLSLYFSDFAWPLGLAYALSGRVDEALPLLNQAVEQKASVGFWARHALVVAALGEGLLLAGGLEEARHRAEQALDFARLHQAVSHQAYALRLLGDIAARRDPPEREPAEAYYQQGLALARTLAMRPLQAHCHRGLGTLCAITGQRQQARAELETALTLYRAMDMTFWLAQTEAVLTQVGDAHGL